MINIFDHTTADEAWCGAAEKFIRENGWCQQQSRLGLIREHLHCVFNIQNPIQRWVTSRMPSINPAFAIAELIWILCGRNDAAFLNYWNPALPRFAGTGDVYYGAYGHRLRRSLGFDQLERAYFALKQNPTSRQVVLQIWDGRLDMPEASGLARADDIPCNIVSTLKVRDGRLEWLQLMRSNDLFLGTPHNFVQFTSLQEVIAGWLGLEVGSFVLMVDSLHIYEDDLRKLSINDNAPRIANTDSLALPKHESDQVVLSLANTMDCIVTAGEKLTSAVLMRLVNDFSGPQPWRNLLYIVAADVARRRGFVQEVYQLQEMCSNSALLAVWNGWCARWSGS